MALVLDYAIEFDFSTAQRNCLDQFDAPEPVVSLLATAVHIDQRILVTDRDGRKSAIFREFERSAVQVVCGQHARTLNDDRLVEFEQRSHVRVRIIICVRVRGHFIFSCLMILNMQGGHQVAHRRRVRRIDIDCKTHQRFYLEWQR